MKFLALDTTKAKSYIFLINDNKREVRVLEETRKVSENLLLEIDKLLNDNNLKVSDIDIFGAVAGPGSFTGVRIGLATLKAFNSAVGKKLIKINSFEAFQEVIKDGILILFSTKTAVYYAEIINSNIVEMSVLDIDKIKERFEGKKLFIIEESLKEVVTADFIDDYEEKVLNCFENRIKTETFVSNNDFAPLYLQLSQAELNLKRNSNK